MKLYANQELASGILFFTSLGWLVIEVVRHAPEEAPSLLPLIPMFLAIVWYVGIEHMRARHPSPNLPAEKP